MKSHRRLIAATWALVLLVGCGQTKMMETMGQVRSHMINGTYEVALAKLRQAKEKGAFKEQDRVMFYMEEGMLLYLTRQYKEAVASLSLAEERSKVLYTTSVSKSIKAAFTSDAAKDYKGEEYESVLLNVFKAFAFLGMSQWDGAMVEVNKINDKLAQFNTTYQGKFVYNQDAFAHWLAGILAEGDKNYEQARVSYVKAHETYSKDFAANYGMPTPSYLVEDILRVAKLSGGNDVFEQWKGKGGQGGATAEQSKSMGEIVLLHLNGEGPSKTDYFINCIFKSAANWRCDGEPGGEFIRKTTITIAPGWTTMKIAFPMLIMRKPGGGPATVSVGGATGQSELAYPLTEIARKVFRDSTGRVFRDAIIRAVTKTLTTKAAGAIAGKAGGGLFGKLTEAGVGAAMQATEEADKRCWTTLPSQIDVARVWAPAGVHTVTINVKGRTLTIPNVKVTPGKRVFVNLRTLP